MPSNNYTLKSTTDLGITAPHTDNKISITNADFKKLYPTGITITLNLPIVKTSDDFIFGINLDGYIPQFNVIDSTSAIPAATPRKSLYRNLFPVQFRSGVYNAVSPIGRIVHDIHTMAIQSFYQSHRYVDGAVNVVMRLSSNTSMSGNLQLARVRTATRQFFTPDQEYRGLQFSNYVGNISDMSQESFALLDLSLNRTAEIACDRSPTTGMTDIAYKIDRIARSATGSIIQQRPFEQQFTEDWLLVGLASDLPASQSNVLNIALYLDYTNVTFEMPLLFSPSAPINNSSVPGKVLDVTASFYNATSAKEYVFLPLPPPLFIAIAPHDDETCEYSELSA
jgi:hypothetical protein